MIRQSQEIVYPDYYKHFLHLINIQQSISEEEYKKTQGMPVGELKRRGRCIDGLRVSRVEYVYDRREGRAGLEKLRKVTFIRDDKRKFRENSFVVGSRAYLLNDPVPNTLFKQGYIRAKGIIVHLSEDSIVVEMSPEEEALHGGKKNLALVLGADQVTYPNQMKMLSYFCSGVFEGNNDTRELIIDALDGKGGEIDINEEQVIDFFRDVDESKKDAIRKIMGSNSIFLLHGPPGTGKTETLAEVVCQTLRKDLNARVLVCCDSNEAVDNILLKVADILKPPSDSMILRIGHISKVQDRTKKYTLSEKYTNHPLYKHFMKNILFDEEVFYRKEKERKRKEYGRATRSSNREIKDQYWYECKKAEQKEFAFTKQIKKLRETIHLEIIRTARIVFCTNTNAARPDVQHRLYDLVVIDEATQATEPSCLIPICCGKKVVLAGDHKQLPPTVLLPDSDEKMDETKELRTSLFEKLISQYKGISYRLKKQYRMNDILLSFPNRESYDEELESGEGNKDARLDLFFDSPLVFIDCEKKEGSVKDTVKTVEAERYSKYNDGEVDVVREIVSSFRRLGIRGNNLTVVTPYNAQKKRLIGAMKELNEKIGREYRILAKTIDGCQGQENEIIVLSLVRSNEKSNIGFLRDERRFNVSITRAKRKLIAVGNARTLIHSKKCRVYARWIKHVKENGLFIHERDLDSYIKNQNLDSLRRSFEEYKSQSNPGLKRNKTIDLLINEHRGFFDSLDVERLSKGINLLFDTGWSPKLPQGKRLSGLLRALTRENTSEIIRAFHWISFRKYYLPTFETPPRFIDVANKDRVQVQKHAVRMGLITEDELDDLGIRVEKARSNIGTEKRMRDLNRARRLLDKNTSGTDTPHTDLDENMVLKDLFS